MSMRGLRGLGGVDISSHCFASLGLCVDIIVGRRVGKGKEGKGRGEIECMLNTNHSGVSGPIYIFRLDSSG